MPGGANDVPEPAPRAIAALEKPHAARAQVRPYGFRPELADDAAEPLGDLVERPVPGDPFEVAGPLRADAPHRVPEPLRGLRVRDVVVELLDASSTQGDGETVCREFDGSGLADAGGAAGDEHRL